MLYNQFILLALVASSAPIGAYPVSKLSTGDVALGLDTRDIAIYGRDDEPEPRKKGWADKMTGTTGTAIKNTVVGCTAAMACGAYAYATQNHAGKAAGIIGGAVGTYSAAHSGAEMYVKKLDEDHQAKLDAKKKADTEGGEGEKHPEFEMKPVKGHNGQASGSGTQNTHASGSGTQPAETTPEKGKGKEPATGSRPASPAGSTKHAFDMPEDMLNGRKPKKTPSRPTTPTQGEGKAPEANTPAKGPSVKESEKESEYKAATPEPTEPKAPSVKEPEQHNAASTSQHPASAPPKAASAGTRTPVTRPTPKKAATS